MGEVVLRGNTVMSGYLDDPAATAEAFRGGWLHSGDAAVVHPDGRIELRDRFKDVIVSGGENISTIEVEQALARHPAVLDCAVVGIPDVHWGERPKAFVELRPGMQAPAEELTAFCREQLASFKCPDTRGVRQPAPHGDRQGAEVRAARARMGGPRAPRQLERISDERGGRGSASGGSGRWTLQSRAAAVAAGLGVGRPHRRRSDHRQRPTTRPEAIRDLRRRLILKCALKSAPAGCTRMSAWNETVLALLATGLLLAAPAAPGRAPSSAE